MTIYMVGVMFCDYNYKFATNKPPLLQIHVSGDYGVH